MNTTNTDMRVKLISICLAWTASKQSAQKNQPKKQGNDNLKTQHKYIFIFMSPTLGLGMDHPQTLGSICRKSLPERQARF